MKQLLNTSAKESENQHIDLRKERLSTCFVVILLLVIGSYQVQAENTFKISADTLDISRVLGAVSDTAAIAIGSDAILSFSGYVRGRDVTVNGTLNVRGELIAHDLFVTGGTTFGAIELNNNLDLTNATVNLNVEDTQGTFEDITVSGNVSIYEGCTLNLTVNRTTRGDIIKLIDSPNSLHGVFEHILINGEDISGKPFVWHAGTGELEVLNGMVGIQTEEINARTIQSIDYYDLTGLKITKNTTGFVIRKITYTDGSVEMAKTFVEEKN
jgi:hypothetical protein